jgi:dienelactone hydrolase
VRQTAARAVGVDYQRLRYPSGFIPEPLLPGADRWVSHERNRECAAWMMRHDQPGRPWLLCIHGYRMGFPLADFRLFEPKHLHHKLGLNLLMPILPLHGPRRLGWQSGDYYLDGDLLELLHAETQALWDLRRAIAWIRTQDPAARIGVLGYSLGGYNASLLATHEPGLDFVVAGIAVADFVPLLWGHLPAPHRAYFEAHGLNDERLRTLLHVVSPLACAPQLPAERLHLFAGSADRVVPPDQPLRLAKHWGRPIEWYQGGHLTFRGEPGVERCIEAAIAGAGWVRDRA